MPSYIKTPKYLYQITRGGSYYTEQEIRIYYPDSLEAETVMKQSDEFAN